MKVLFYSLSLFFIFFSVSCSSKKNSASLHSLVSTQIKNDSTITFFGKVYVKKTIEASSLLKTDFIGSIIQNELNDFSSGININKPIYFTVHGLLQKQGFPEEITIYSELKSKDSLCDKISSLGYFLKHKEGVSFVEKPLFSILINDDVALFHYGKPIGLKKLQQKMTASEEVAKPISINIDKSLKSTSFISLTAHLKNIHVLQSKMSSLSPKNQGAIEALLSDAFLSATVVDKLNEFQVNIAHLFNEKLKHKCFLTSGDFIKLDDAMYNSHCTYHLDPVKADAFIATYYPEFLEKIIGSRIELQFALLSLGKSPIASLTNGNGSVSFGLTDAMAFNCFSLCNEFDENKSITKIIYSSLPALLGSRFSTSETGNKFFLKSSNQGCSLKSNKLPSDFGIKGVDFYYVPSQQTKSESGFTTLLRENSSFVRIQVSNDDSKIIIRGKNKNKTMFEQVVDYFMNQYTSGNLSI